MPDLVYVLQSHAIPVSPLRRLGDTDAQPSSYYLEVPGAEAVARWSALRNIVDRTGHWPVLLGGDEDLRRRMQAMADVRFGRHEQIIAEARALDSEAWLHAR